VIVNRIALNFDQVEEHNPPPNPAKLTDSRAKGYIAEYGYHSWELDALDPLMMRDLIKETVWSYRDEDQYHKVLDREREYIKTLKRIEENWKTL
jgi:hypothetical protein